MPISPIEIYNILPKTDCKDCGEQTCFAFATKVVVEKKSLSLCPYIKDKDLKQYQTLLKEQYRNGKWVKKEPAKEALKWAKQRAASLKIPDLKDRIGGELVSYNNKIALKLPYFTTYVYITEDDIYCEDRELNHYEKVFIYNHMAQGGKSNPTGKYVPFHDLPNTISKQKSMEKHIEKPIEEKFRGKKELLKQKGLSIGGIDVTYKYNADIAIEFSPLPKIPILLLFWDEEKGEECFPPKTMLLFDKNVLEHLDIESILFLCEQLVSMLVK